MDDFSESGQWYSARILVQCKVGDADPNPLVDEQVVLFRAASEAEARTAAESYAANEAHEYLNEAGEVVRWFLREIQDLSEVPLEPNSRGWEVHSRLLRESELPDPQE